MHFSLLEVQKSAKKYLKFCLERPRIVAKLHENGMLPRPKLAFVA